MHHSAKHIGHKPTHTHSVLLPRQAHVHLRRLPPTLVTPFISELPDKFCLASAGTLHHACRCPCETVRIPRAAPANVSGGMVEAPPPSPQLILPTRTSSTQQPPASVPPTAAREDPSPGATEAPPLAARHGHLGHHPQGPPEAAPGVPRGPHHMTTLGHTCCPSLPQGFNTCTSPRATPSNTAGTSPTLATLLSTRCTHRLLGPNHESRRPHASDLHDTSLNVFLYLLRQQPPSKASSNARSKAPIAQVRPCHPHTSTHLRQLQAFRPPVADANWQSRTCSNMPGSPNGRSPDKPQLDARHDHCLGSRDPTHMPSNS